MESEKGECRQDEEKEAKAEEKGDEKEEGDENTAVAACSAQCS